MMVAGTEAKRDNSVAKDILDLAQRIADRSDVIAGKVHMRLGPVMMPPSPPTEAKPEQVSRTYPPLFDELRERCRTIERALNSIEEALSRTEL